MTSGARRSIFSMREGRVLTGMSFAEPDLLAFQPDPIAPWRSKRASCRRPFRHRSAHAPALCHDRPCRTALFPCTNRRRHPCNRRAWSVPGAGRRQGWFRRIRRQNWRPLGCDGDLVAHLFPWSATMPPCKKYSLSAAEMSPAAFSPHLARALPRLCPAAQCQRWRQTGVRAGAQPLLADLDDRASLGRLAGLADVVLHLAPPPGEGKSDTRTRNLLAALGKGKSLPRSLIYVSTTGVYGDCGGALSTKPGRSTRKARAPGGGSMPSSVCASGVRVTGVRISILRAPGIYAADRLPSSAWQKACRRWPRPMMYSPITFMPMIWRRPVSPRCATGKPTGPTMWSMIPI
jgi:hypothetical protein